ncbi:hypothetical protein GOP47_0023054 [Adiantum capillus-veneris]|uniref:NYN domain-containing protein n=1 Tax=Adiantum capillus-veneris TaxID=13818 RepID=A0A9D4Z648_ADICA|nr:hypothetical protein GOP47_0023054 [Adiantum capillus-veneris]
MWKGAAAKLLMKDSRCREFCSRAEVSVFWDLNKCGVTDADVEGDGESECEAAMVASNIAPNVVKSLRSSGFSGPISIRAYGNTRSFSNHRIMQALLATGVDLHHTSAGKNYLSKHLILDLLLWVRENKPPAHMLLISGDKEFSSVLHKLHMRGYNVLLAHPEGDISKDLLSAASKVWVWDKMMKGTEEVQPERVDVDQDPTSHGLKRKPLNIPKRIVEQVLDIIRSRPSGFSVSALRRQLVRSNITLDKDLYGHKDLLSFLLAIPNLKARLLWTSDKTRTFFFTENLDESTNINEDSKGALSTSPDSKNAKQEMFNSMLGEKCSVIKMKKVSCLQQLNDKSPLDQCSEESIAEVSSGVGLLLNDKETKSPGFFSGGVTALSSLWNKTQFKLMALRNAWQFVSPKASKKQQICSRLSFIDKGKESKPINENINAESHISSVSSSSPEKEKKVDIAYSNISNETIQGDRHKIVRQSGGCAALEDEQEDGKSQLLGKRRGRQCGRHNEDGATTVLHKDNFAFTDPRLIDELCEDAILYVWNEGSTMCTRSITA